MYGVLVCSFPVSGHILSERALSKVMYHTAHRLSVICMIVLHLLMTLVAHVNSGFVSLHVAFKVANKHWQACTQTCQCVCIQVRLRLAYHIW